MNKMTGIWPWPVHHTLHQRLRSSEHQRMRNGTLAAPVLNNRGPVAPVRHRSCQWPQGEPRSEDFRFCGVPVTPGRPYCTAHCAIAYIPDGAEEPEETGRDNALDPRAPEEIGPDELWPDALPDRPKEDG